MCLWEDKYYGYLVFDLMSKFDIILVFDLFQVFSMEIIESAIIS